MITIIIPVYNSEKYLKTCFDSVKNQTYKDLEIIIVNDGSTDNSLKICEEFEKEDSRVRIINKENGGLSSARNAGIEEANGEIITFLDSDDYFDSCYIEKSIKLMDSEDADVVIMQMCNVSENTNNIIKNNEEIKKYMFNSEEAIEESLYQSKFTCCAPGKIYKREVVGDIRFPFGKLAEDLAVCHKFLANANKIVYSNEFEYFYRQHDSSIMHTFNPRRMDALEWSNEIEKYCEQYFPNIVQAAKCRTFNVAIHLLLDIPKNGEARDKCIDKIKSEIKRTRKTVLFNHKARKRDRMAALISYFGENILKLIWNSKVSVKKKEY